MECSHCTRALRECGGEEFNRAGGKPVLPGNSMPVDECSSGHDDREGSTSKAKCLALKGCIYDAVVDHCYVGQVADTGSEVLSDTPAAESPALVAARAALQAAKKAFVDAGCTSSRARRQSSADLANLMNQAQDAANNALGGNNVNDLMNSAIDAANNALNQAQDAANKALGGNNVNDLMNSAMDAANNALGGNNVNGLMNSAMDAANNALGGATAPENANTGAE